MSLLKSFRDTIYSLTSCCISNPIIYVNKQRYKVISLIGEGNYSFVYLVRNESSRQLYTLKKVNCSIGNSIILSDALNEVNMYKLFQSQYIIPLNDLSVSINKDGSKTVYMFLPYYKRGNLQDNIDANNIKGNHFPEKDLLQFFLKVALGLQVLHTNRNSNGDLEPFAHRDLKPRNILISDDSKTPVLIDFNSVIKARIPIHTRQDGLLQQDIAADYSTSSYRAPELFDVKTGSILDEKVDIWSLGCTLYTAAYGQNPFEATINDMEGSIALAVLNGQYKFPEDKEQVDPYSKDFKELIQCMLIIDPAQRPDIHQVSYDINNTIDLSLV